MGALDDFIASTAAPVASLASGRERPGALVAVSSLAPRRLPGCFLGALRLIFSFKRFSAHLFSSPCSILPLNPELFPRSVGSWTRRTLNRTVVWFCSHSPACLSGCRRAWSARAPCPPPRACAATSWTPSPPASARSAPAVRFRCAPPSPRAPLPPVGLGLGLGLGFTLRPEGQV